MANIRVTPEELNAQGEDLKRYAEGLKSILKEVDEKIGMIDDGWDGLAQDAYLDMYQEMKTSLDQFPELVNSIGEATVGAANAFAQVDEELQRGFSS